MIYKGSLKPVHGEIKGEIGNYFASDETVDFNITFYIQGKEKVGSYKISKSDCIFNTEDGGTNEFDAVIDTNKLDTGRLLAQIDVHIKDGDYELLEIFTVDLNETIQNPAFPLNAEEA